MRVKNALFLVFGCLCTGLGGIGAVVPLLPTVPFLLLAAYCFAHSSEKWHRWFTGTRLYRENLESYVRGNGMTARAKARILSVVTLLMGVGFLLMRSAPAGRIALCVVWALHGVYLLFGVKTLPPER